MSRRGFLGTRPACRGTPEAPVDVLGVRFGKVGVRLGKVPTAIYRPRVRFGIISTANNRA